MKTSIEIVNRKAKFNFELIESYEAGIVLLGSEVKSIKTGKCNLSDNFCYFIDNELFTNFHISENEYGKHDPIRAKKLLLTKKELYKLKNDIEIKRMTVVPFKIFVKKRLIKLIIYLAKGKNKSDKRESLKEKEFNKTKKELL